MARLKAPSLRPAADSCRVALLSPNDIFADALERMIADVGFAQMVCHEADDQRCLDALRKQGADILLVNAKSLAFPFDLFFHRFYEVHPELRIMVFGHEDHRAFVRSLMLAGCRGFIDDEITQEGLREAIRSVMQGHLWANRGLLSQIAVEGLELQRVIEQHVKERIGLLNGELCPREADVFSLALEGLSTQEIADALHISKQSVKVYLHRLFLKFEVSNRSQLIVAAFERVCPVDHLIQLLRETLNHSTSWKEPATIRRPARPLTDRAD